MRYKYLTAYVVSLVALLLIAPAASASLSIEKTTSDRLSSSDQYELYDPNGDDDPHFELSSDAISISNDGDNDPPSNYELASDRLYTDSDGDGIPDCYDAFPYDPYEWLDSDGDGVGDNADLDDDNDGIPDESDAFPYDPTEWDDFDGDDIGDNADLDDDNDGIPDESDAFPYDPYEWLDSDGDGIGDNADPDDDGDGWLDEEEIEYGTDPKDEDSYPGYNQYYTTYYYYNLTIYVVGNGSVNPSEGVYSYINDTPVNLTATADPGWVFDQWENLSSSNPNETILMNDNKTVTACFVLDPQNPEEVVNFTLEYSVFPSGAGSIFLAPFGGIYENGTKVNITATSDSGWVFVNWSGDDIDGSVNLTEQIVMNSNKSVTANFAVENPVITEYNLTVGIEGSGNVTLDPTGGIYPLDTIVELEASADPGWMFDHWSGDDIDGSINLTENITMDDNKSVIAYFIELDDSQLDTDGDGITDDEDAFPYDPTEWDDFDGDDIGDNADPDDDNDGIPDESDVFPYDPYEWKDTDGDGIGDNADPDDDGDGWSDDEEDEYGTDPKDADSRPDKENTESNLEDDTNQNSYNYNYQNEEEDNTLFYIAVGIAFIVFIVVCFFILREKDEDIEPEDVKVDVFNSKI